MSSIPFWLPGPRATTTHPTYGAGISAT